MALAFSSNTVLRQAVRLAEGRLRLVEWDLASGQAVASSTAGPQHIVRAGFDTSANTLVMVSAAPGDERLGTDGIWIWRLPGSTQVWQLSGEMKAREGVLSGDGRWALAVASFGLAIDAVDPGLPHERYDRLLFTETGVETPTVITMDAIGEDYAYALEDGEVREEHRLGNGWHQLATSGERVLALQFDAARRYLGILRERGLTLAVLRIPGGLGDRRVTLDPMAGGALAFGPTSDLLAIASDRGWEVRDTRRLRRLCGAPLPGCTAIAFSPDGCQLAVGDAEGTVYLYRLGGD